MRDQGNSGFVKRLQFSSQIAAAFGVFVGCVVLAGWVLDKDTLKSVVPGLITMKANTAIAFLLASLSLWLLGHEQTDSSKGARRRRVAYGFALMVVLIGGLSLGEYLLGRNFGIDQLLFVEAPGAVDTSSPGRMAPTTALNFVLLGCALLFLDLETSRGLRPAQYAAILAGCIAYMALTGYLLSVVSFYRVATFTGMALNTSVTFIVLCLGGMNARPDRGLMAVVSSESAGGILARRFLPLVFFLPLLLGWLRLEGQKAGMYGTEFGLALYATTIVAAFAVLMYRASISLQQADIQRKRAEEALRTNEKLLSTTLGSIGDAVIATDQNGSVTFLNAVAQALTGWTQEAAQGQSLDIVFNIINAENRQPVENPVYKVFRAGKVVGLADHTVLLSKSGREFDIEDSAAPIVTREGERIGVVLVFRDVTQRRKVEEERERFFTLSRDMICIAGFDGYFKSLNPAWEKTLGFTPGELLSAPYLEFVHPEDRDATTAEAAKLATGLDTISFENRYRCKDGSYKWLLWSCAPAVGHQSIYAVARDNTDRKRTEEALRQANAWRQAILDYAGFALISTTPEGVIQTFNPAAERMLGYTAKEVVGRYTPAIIHDPQEVAERARMFSAELETSIDPGFEVFVAKARRNLPNEHEWTYIRKDGTRLTVLLSVTALRDRDGLITGFLGIASDITERKKAEEVILRAKEEAERTSKFKDQFLSTMSHELRTPLNAVLGFSELLADDHYGPLNDKQRRYVGHIHSGGQHLLKLINDILDLSKIEAGRLELAIEEVPVAAAFAEVLSALRPLAEKKSQSVVQECIEKLAVRADSMRFKQILMNLLGNAIKFTPEGGRIELAAHSVDSKVRVEVRDTGPGIPPEEQKRIFESFYRLRQSGQAPEGTGLGLAITQRLVELHGGELNMESLPGQGSCFFFSLPASAGFGKALKGHESISEKPDGVPKILVIEDDLTAAHLIEMQLSASGYEPVICDQPQRAVEIAAALQPSAITLDLLMKPVTGWEILLQLKSDLQTKRIPVILLTIVDQPGVGMTLGADEYLIKPVKKEVLLEAIARCLDSRGRAPELRPILVVEDDAATRDMIAELLRSQGFSVAVAEDGAQARASVEASLPELIILDLLLPKVSGFDLLAEWHASPRTAEVPVFVLTGKDLTPAEQAALRTHAELLLRKQQPWQEELIQQLRRVLPRALQEGT